ncbi:MAG TPA: hypothetical protein VFE27_11025 [Acidobacteriaceae bacterium]|jgi:hypothetical protein|nr:hypothetical protein [Acidobacteriaceae bacterium]
MVRSFVFLAAAAADRYHARFRRHTFPKADQGRILFVLNVPGEYHMA